MLEFQNTKNVFAKGYAPNWSEEVFVVSNDYNSEEITRSFYEKELQKTSQEELRI